MAGGAVLLCHRRRRGGGRDAFFEAWATRRAALVAGERERLGFEQYYQVHRVSRWNVVYRAIRLSRSWPVTAFVSLLRGLTPPSRSPADPPPSEERWDLVEVLLWREPESMRAMLETPPAAAALRRLAEDASSQVRRTAPIVAERIATTPASDAAAPGVVTLFCLRAREGLGRNAMLRYWLERHGPFVAGMQRALRFSEYDQFAVRDEDGVGSALRENATHEAPPFDGVAALASTTMAELWRGLVSPRTQIANARLVWDEVGFMAATRSALVFGRIRHRL